MMTATQGRSSDPYANIAALLDKPDEAKKLLKEMADLKAAIAKERQELTKAKSADEMLKRAASDKKSAGRAVERAKERAVEILREASDEISGKRAALEEKEKKIDQQLQRRAGELNVLQESLGSQKNELENALSGARAKLDSAQQTEKRALEKETRVEGILDDLKKLKHIRVSAK